MKIVKELPEIFDEFGEQRRKAFLEINHKVIFDYLFKSSYMPV